MMRFKLCLITGIILSVSLTALAAVPQLINYQGLLKNNLGNPVPNGSYPVTFTIYNAPTGGINLWSETQSVTTSSGLFTALLGSTPAPIPDSIFNDTTSYLGIKVGADPEMTPRQRLASVGYSYISNQWTSLDSNLFRLNGNVGIGTNAPYAKLEVYSSSVNGIVSSSYTTGGVGVQAYGSYKGLVAAGVSGPGVEGRSDYVGVSGSAGDYSPSPIYGCIGSGENNSTGDAYGGSFGGYTYGGGKGYGVSGGGSTYGVYGGSTNGYGVYGHSTGIAAVFGDIGGNFGTYGGYFQGDVKVERNLVVNGTSYSSGGVNASSASGPGVVASGGTNGVEATGTSSGIYATGGAYGVYGVSPSSYGVFGTSNTSYGVYGTSSTSYGVYGYSASGTGVYGLNSSGRGVLGSSAFGPGVVAYGGTNGVETEGTSRGVYATGGFVGVLGVAICNCFPSYGIYGSDGGNRNNTWSGYFDGRVGIVGKVSSAGGGFKIDHPTDPANQYLYHSFVESPDMKNIYDGVVTTDAQGNGVVTLPEWFGTLNRDFRYQLTVIGQFAQAIISKEIANNQFSIQTDKPNVKVSWQITGIRQDAYANAHRIQVEEDKPEAERGKYLHPKELGMSEALGIDYEMTQKLAEERKLQEEQRAKTETELKQQEEQRVNMESKH